MTLKATLEPVRRTIPSQRRDSSPSSPSSSPFLLPSAFAGAWLLPISTHLLGLDFLLLPVIVYLTGGLLRVGATVLDRLMATLTVLGGGTVALGLLFSVWPFGLSPVAIGGVVLSGLVAAIALLRRAPRWPRRFRGSDAVILGGLAWGAVMAGLPVLRADARFRLGYVFLTGDRTRHFNLFDIVHRVGGYPFLHPAAAKPLAESTMLSQYPPGAHFVYALIDTFVVSNTNPGAPAAEAYRYYAYVCLGYGFLAAATAWAARWVAGPALAGWRTAFLTTGIVAFVTSGVLTTTLWCTWDSQVFAMAFLALAAAFAFRPPVAPREYFLLLAAPVVAIGMSYQLFLPLTAVLVLTSAFVYRERWLPHWRPMLLAAVPATLIAAVPIIVGVLSGLRSGSHALLAAFIIPITHESLLAVVVLLLLGGLSAAARRRPTLRAAALAITACGLGVLAFNLYQHATIGRTAYYYEKAVQGWLVIALTAIGAVGHLLPRIASAQERRKSWILSVTAALAAVLATGSIPFGGVDFDYGTMATGRFTTWSSVWMDGLRIFPVHAGSLGYLARNHYLGDKVPTVVLADAEAQNNEELSFVLAAMNHDTGRIADQIYALVDPAELNVLRPDPKRSGSAYVDRANLRSRAVTPPQQASLEALERSLLTSPLPLRVLTNDRTVAEALRQFAVSHPEAGLTVRFLPALPAGSTPTQWF